MFAPKKVESLDAWFKEARKVLPKIPNPYEDPEWSIQDKSVSAGWIKWILHHKPTGKLAVVTIDRRASSLG